MHHLLKNNSTTSVPQQGLLEVGRIPWSSWMNLGTVRGVSVMTPPWQAVHSRRGFPGPVAPVRQAEFGREATLRHQQRPPPFHSTSRLPKSTFGHGFICGHRGIPFAAPSETLSTHPLKAGTLLFLQLSSQQGSDNAQRENWS